MSENNLFKKLREIQAALKAPKSQYNTFGKYKYRNLEDILEAVKPLLYEQELLLVLNEDIVEVGGRVYVRATAYLSDGSDSKPIICEAYAREPESRKGMDESQITGTASSYARKYALNGLFLIDDTKDADTMPPPQEEPKPAATTKPAEPKQQKTFSVAQVVLAIASAKTLEEAQSKYDKAQKFEHLMGDDAIEVALDDVKQRFNDLTKTQ